ncbi:MAG: ATP-dependent Clp protease proteolytic subunit [Verrucomicrobiales bacterium]|nr:ATP-dependent Clp protease proteolytic subunit [Verrucomicrobiales bacterium]
MKNYFVRALTVAILAFVVLYFLGPYEEGLDAGDEVNLIKMVDAIIDSGIENQPDVADPGFLAGRRIVVTTDVNAAFSRSVINQFLALDRDNAQKPIDLFLRTEGGWEADAFAVIDLMRSLKSPVNVHALGEVHSAGAMILTAGTGRRIVYENTLLGFHALADDEEPPFDTRYLEFWRQHAELPEEWLARTDNELIYFTSEDAIEMGLADEVFPSP